MSNFTSGPWQAEELAEGCGKNERPWVGRLQERRFTALSCGDTQEIAIANARLIAAAPELLEALCVCQSRMNATLEAMDLYNEKNGTHIIGPSLLALGRQIAANAELIAKATNPQPATAA